MKIRSVEIEGMHKVNKQKYEFNNNITYLIGPNGAGKSTILEAIQLALLGYIPGYSKKNDAIMKHSANKLMSVELTLDNNAKIERTWMRDKTSVKSSLSTTGINYDKNEEDGIQFLIGNATLPVFDFNEFRSMTANNLKDWFINFLPPSSESIDIAAELIKGLDGRKLPYESLIEDVKERLNNSDKSALEVVRELHTLFKENQSYYKGQIDKLTGTIQSLIRYDDEEVVDESEVNAKLAKYSILKDQVIKYNAEVSLRQNTLKSLEALKASLPAPSINEDERIAGLKKSIEELQKKIDVLKIDYSDLQTEITELERQKSLLPRAGSTCPYTNEHCDIAAKLVEETKEQVAELDKQIAFKREEMKDCDSSKWSALQAEALQLTAELGTIQAQYDKLASMEIQLKNCTTSEPPTDLTLEQINTEINRLNESLIHIAANKRYDELSSKVANDKFRLESELEIYKIWTKLTDANGLQTTLMNKPFEDLAEEMSSYLTKMFNAETAAQFNLVNKANSFSFGLNRKGQYIEFDYLSSGERCLFTLALILCILDKSQSQIKTILIDDILDHLDTDNASYLFDALKNIEDVQFILAGVKECSDKTICLTI